ncbi:MAG TPA: histidine phosphatase family protein [Bacteroidia bacterium]|nr:histidine phosphatase family protein [Bacteroidia bacterium]
MKVIWFIRHAKSSWDLDLDDMYRPLNDRGYRDAVEMANRFKKISKVSLIFTSPAVRAYSTALIFAKTLNYDPALITLSPLLYDTGAKQHQAVIAGLPPETDEVAFFGHNPTISEVANLMAGTELAEIPTAAIVGVESDVTTWKDAAYLAGKLLHYDYPKNSGG